MTQIHTLKAGAFNFDHIGWKYYNAIRKKAMEQEFSWSGLVISLSIAFFVVVTTAYCLSMLNKTMMINSSAVEQNTNIYQLETRINYLQSDLIDLSPIANYNRLS